MDDGMYCGTAEDDGLSGGTLNRDPAAEVLGGENSVGVDRSGRDKGIRECGDARNDLQERMHRKA
jgi:hypothetical protein